MEKNYWDPNAFQMATIKLAVIAWLQSPLTTLGRFWQTVSSAVDTEYQLVTNSVLENAKTNCLCLHAKSKTTCSSGQWWAWCLEETAETDLWHTRDAAGGRATLRHHTSRTWHSSHATYTDKQSSSHGYRSSPAVHTNTTYQCRAST